MDEKKVFGTILDRKEAYWDYEIPFKKYPKIYIFPWFLSKSADFSILCFNGKWINGHFSNFFF